MACMVNIKKVCAIYKADCLFIKNVFQLMYYANTVYTVERTCLTTLPMNFFNENMSYIVRNLHRSIILQFWPILFNNNRCIKPSWELSIKKNIFCCITKSLALLIKRKLIRLRCKTHQITFIFINDKTVEINCFQVAVYFEASSLK